MDPGASGAGRRSRTHRKSRRCSAKRAASQRTDAPLPFLRQVCGEKSELPFGSPITECIGKQHYPTSELTLRAVYRSLPDAACLTASSASETLGRGFSLGSPNRSMSTCRPDLQGRAAT